MHIHFNITIYHCYARSHLCSSISKNARRVLATECPEMMIGISLASPGDWLESKIYMHRERESLQNEIAHSTDGTWCVSYNLDNSRFIFFAEKRRVDRWWHSNTHTSFVWCGTPVAHNRVWIHASALWCISEKLANMCKGSKKSLHVECWVVEWMSE